VSNPVDDQTIVRSCLQGDERAFAELVSRYNAAIYRLAWRMLRNEEEARDVVQEVFLRVYRALASYDQNRKFSTWILRIATNLCIDRLRRKKVKLLSINIDDSDEDRVPVILAEEGPGPDALYGKTSLREKLDEMIMQMTPIYRIVVELRYKQGLSYDEISAVLEIPLGTVKARLHRAHRYLKDELEAGGIGPDLLDR